MVVAVELSLGYFKLPAKVGWHGFYNSHWPALANTSAFARTLRNGLTSNEVDELIDRSILMSVSVLGTRNR